jgi:hypothetical protein
MVHPLHVLHPKSLMVEYANYPCSRMLLNQHYLQLVSSDFVEVKTDDLLPMMA